MKTLHFSISINAPKEKVWDTMLTQETYRAWTADFSEGSYYEGSWVEGAKIRFLGPGESGMSSIIAVNKPHAFISIKHIGFIEGGVEDTESDAVKAWTPAFENYTFIERDGVTELAIDVDVAPDFEQDMVSAWPKALEKLKELSER